MKNCEVMLKGFCTGCTGLAEKDWCGPEQCDYYKKFKQYEFKENKGIQEKIEL